MAADVCAQSVQAAGRPDSLFAHGTEGWPVHQLRTLPVPVRELMAGGIAGATAKSCVAPLERCKILFQTGKLHYAHVPDALSNIWRTEGVRGLFRGNGASVLRIVPYASFHFGAYEYFRRHLVDAGFAGASPASVPPFVDLLAGSTAGASAVLLTYPLDLVRTRLAFHTESNGGGGSSSSSSSAASSSSATRSAAAVCATSSGSSSVGGALAARRGGLAAVQAGGRAAGGLGASTSGMAGAAAAGRGLLHGLPHPANAALTIRGVLVATWQREGLRGMYHGLGASFWGILPYAGLKFYVYQHLKRWYLGFGSSSRAGGAAAAEGTPAAGVARNRQRLPVTLMLGFGAVAGLVAQTATYPVDVVRRRMQVEGLSQHVAVPTGAEPPVVRTATSYVLRSTPQALMLLVEREGWRTLWRGLSINYMKVVPSTAIGFTIYDALKGWLDLPQNL